MPYLNLDDDFTEHPKVEALSDPAFRLWISGLRYCAKNTTDGVIPAWKVPTLIRTYKAAHLRELLRSRLWHEGGDGCGSDQCLVGQAGEYVAHDYLQWNKPRAWWDERRKAEAERKAEYRRKRAEEKARLAELEAQQKLRSV